MSKTAALVVLSFVAALASGPLAGAPATSVTPSLRITSFDRSPSGDPTRVSAARVGPAGTSAPRSTTIDLGSSVDLGWTVEACHMETITVSLVGVGDLPLGSRHQQPDGCFWISGQRAVTPNATTTYRLQVSGTPVAGASVAPTPVTSSFEVVVRAPRLDVLEPRVDDASLGLTFRARNQGDADLGPSTIEVRYSVRGVIRGPSPVIEEGVVRVPGVSIRQGQTAEFGSATLTRRADLYAWDMVSISVTLHPVSTAVADATHSFQHSWPTRTSTIGPVIMGVLSSTSSLDIRLNNYSSSAADGWVANDSHVTLTVANGTPNTRDFSIPATRAVLRVRGTTSGDVLVERDFRILVNRVTASVRNRDDFLTIRDGKLVIHLDIPNSGAEEVKIGRIDEGTFHDHPIPDVDLPPIPVDVLLTPGITADGTRLTLASARVVVPPIEANLHGVIDELVPRVRDMLNTAVHDTVVGQLEGLLARRDVKQAFEDGLAGITTALHATRIVSVGGRGNEITVTYR